MPDPDTPMTNEPLPIPADDTGLAPVASDDEKPEDGVISDMPADGQTAHEAFEEAKEETAQRQEAP